MIYENGTIIWLAMLHDWTEADDSLLNGIYELELPQGTYPRVILPLV